MAQRLRKLSLNRVDLVDRGANPEAHITLFKRDAPGMCAHDKPKADCPLCKSGEVPMPEITKADVDTAVATAVTKALADAAAATEAAIKKAQDEAKVATDAAIKKAQDDAKAVADAEIAKANTALAIEKAIRVRKEYDAKVRVFKCLPMRLEAEGDKPSDVDVLMALGEKAPAELARVEEILRAADESLQKGAAFNEVGSGRQGAAAGDTAQDEIEKRAVALMKADPKLTKAVAIGKALEADPKLYERHAAEQRARAK